MVSKSDLGIHIHYFYWTSALMRFAPSTWFVWSIYYFVLFGSLFTTMWTIIQKMQRSLGSKVESLKLCMNLMVSREEIKANMLENSEQKWWLLKFPGEYTNAFTFLTISICSLMLTVPHKINHSSSIQKSLGGINLATLKLCLDFMFEQSSMKSEVFEKWWKCEQTWNFL